MTAAPMRARGYTLVELCVATSILVVVVGLAVTGFVYVLRGTRQGSIQRELDMDVQKAMEHVANDLRLSALEHICFHPPGPGPYTAVSFPLARPDSEEGIIDLDEEGRIIWDQTVIYHRWPSEPNQLRRTVFDPRIELSAEERQEQVSSVATNGHGRDTHNGEHASTEAIFENLFDWSVRPRYAYYDAYAPELTRSPNVILGSCVIQDGNHTLEFRAIGKNAGNTNSTGYNIGIDSLFMSPSYSVREGEAQYPPTLQSGATALRQYLSAGSWSGNHQLLFPATATNHYVTLTLESDRWEETNFRMTGQTHERTTVVFDEGLTPSDFVVQLEGNDVSWFAKQQTGDGGSGASGADELRGSAVRVLLKGKEMTGGGWFAYDGARCRVQFRAGSDPALGLEIGAACIGECVSSTSESMDVVPGTQNPLSFAGSPSVLIPGGTSVWSDVALLEIDRRKSYLVTFYVPDEPSRGTARKWRERLNPGLPSCYVIPGSAGAAAGNVPETAWSTRSDVVATDCVFAVDALWTRYPTNGVYTSGIFDTHAENPVYRSVAWSGEKPSGTHGALRVRTAAAPDMSDAPAWDTLDWMLSDGDTTLSPQRYVQFQCGLAPNSDFDVSPKLKDVTIRWVGETRVVDVGGTFTKGPDYGILALKVDGVLLTRGVAIDLEIYKDAPTFGRGTVRLTSALTTEVEPRNTGY